MEAQDDDLEPDELDETIREFESRYPDIRSEMARTRVIMRMTTALWQRREELGLTVERVAERSGLTIEEVRQSRTTTSTRPSSGSHVMPRRSACSSNFSRSRPESQRQAPGTGVNG